jgi:hypothetical protein
VVPYFFHVAPPVLNIVLQSKPFTLLKYPKSTASAEFTDAAVRNDGQKEMMPWLCSPPAASLMLNLYRHDGG